MTTNQIGRELARRLVEMTGCDLQTAIRFFYNSELYGELEQLLSDGTDTDVLSKRLHEEFEGNY